MAVFIMTIRSSSGSSSIISSKMQQQQCCRVGGGSVHFIWTYRAPCHPVPYKRSLLPRAPCQPPRAYSDSYSCCVGGGGGGGLVFGTCKPASRIRWRMYCHAGLHFALALADSLTIWALLTCGPTCGKTTMQLCLGGILAEQVKELSFFFVFLRCPSLASPSQSGVWLAPISLMGSMRSLAKLS